MIHLLGVPITWGPTQIHKYFDPKSQNITKVVQIKDSLGKPTKKCLIYTNSPQYAEEFVARYDNDFINSELVKESMRAKIFDLRVQRKKLSPIDSKHRVMLVNLPFEATNVDVSDLCM